MTMKLRVLMSLEQHPDDIVGIVPHRDKVIIATRSRLLVLEHDEEMEFKIRELANHYADLLI